MYLTVICLKTFRGIFFVLPRFDVLPNYIDTNGVTIEDLANPELSLPNLIDTNHSKAPSYEFMKRVQEKSRQPKGGNTTEEELETTAPDGAVEVSSQYTDFVIGNLIPFGEYIIEVRNEM